MPMPYDRNVDYSLIYAMLAVMAICCMMVADRLFIRPAMNKTMGTLALQEYETAFRQLEHPAGTEQLALRSAMAEFGGQPKSCDFYVGEVRRYAESGEAILAAYTDQAVKGHPVQAALLEDGRIPARVAASLPRPLNDLAGWQLPAEAGQGPLYMVYFVLLDGEKNRSFDCR